MSIDSSDHLVLFVRTNDNNDNNKRRINAHMLANDRAVSSSQSDPRYCPPLRLAVDRLPYKQSLIEIGYFFYNK